MTNDQFKILLYGTALFVLVYMQGQTVPIPSLRTSSASAPHPTSYAPYSWWEAGNQHMKPQDSPWLWLEKRPPIKQVSQNSKKDSIQVTIIEQYPVQNHPVEKHPPQTQPTKKDTVYNETSPVERIEMMEKMRRFHIQEQGAKAPPVSL